MYPIIASVIIVFLAWIWEKLQPSSALDEFYGKLFLIVILTEFTLPQCMNFRVSQKGATEHEPFDDTIYNANVDINV